jgi:diaminohydroxyphosphoribosylaminopyrimidine deaminase/5-amino-6-(5-phosphoribosylamino)uracil reductase
MTEQATFDSDDHRFMARALRLAENGLYTCDPNPRVGCVLVRGGEIVGEGWHRWAGGPHAEIVALAAAGKHARGATVYVTLEPCCHHGRTPPCTEALMRAGVARVVTAMQDPNPRVSGKGLETLRRDGIRTECGLLAEEAAALNPGFVKRMQTGLPFVRSKLAMSLDGRTALASGESQWITGQAARKDVHRLRARSSAIVTGIGTVLADDPALTARLEGDVEVLQPTRVILDSRPRLPPTARVLQQPGSIVVFTLGQDWDAIRRLQEAGAEVVTVAADTEGKPELAAVLSECGKRGFNELLFEAGARLNGALLRAGVVEEWVIYLAPCVLGDEALGTFRLSGLTRMTDRPELAIRDVRRVGRDLRLLLGPVSRDAERGS